MLPLESGRESEEFPCAIMLDEQEVFAVAFSDDMGDDSESDPEWAGDDVSEARSISKFFQDPLKEGVPPIRNIPAKQEVGAKSSSNESVSFRFEWSIGDVGRDSMSKSSASMFCIMRQRGFSGGIMSLLEWSEPERTVGYPSP